MGKIFISFCLGNIYRLEAHDIKESALLLPYSVIYFQVTKYLNKH